MRLCAGSPFLQVLSIMLQIVISYAIFCLHFGEYSLSSVTQLLLFFSDKHRGWELASLCAGGVSEEASGGFPARARRAQRAVTSSCNAAHEALTPPGAPGTLRVTWPFCHTAPSRPFSVLYGCYSSCCHLPALQHQWPKQHCKVSETFTSIWCLSSLELRFG